MKTLKLEVGKTYRNRKGEEVKVVRRNNKGRCPCQGNNEEWYTESGRWEDFVMEDPEDLIEEVIMPDASQKHNKMKQIKLEVGKTYRNREGEEVSIVDFCEGIPYPYKGSKGIWYRVDGRWANAESPHDLIEEVPELRYAFITPEEAKKVTATRHTFIIPDGVTKLTVEQVGNRIVVEMVPEKEPKPGDVCINDSGSVYIFKAIYCDLWHNHFAWLGEDRALRSGSWCSPGRPATPEEAQPLWDALKKAGKRWNAEAMRVEEIPEFDRILEWVERHLEDGHYNQEGIAEVIGHYLKHKEGE